VVRVPQNPSKTELIAVIEHPQRRSEQTQGDESLTAWFLGPKAENGPAWNELLTHIFQDYIHWRRNYFPNDPIIISRDRRHDQERWWDHLNNELDGVLNALKAHYPFYSPRYLAHMLSEQSLPSVLGYFAGLLYNPNNVTDEAAPVTVRLEIEVGRWVAEMLGYNPKKAWAHLSSGGTNANLEALWVARATQFVPLMIRDYCRIEAPEFTIKTPDGTQRPITGVDDSVLINLRPNEAIFMARKLAQYEVSKLKRDPKGVLSRINEAMRSSRYNVRVAGYSNVARLLNRQPVLFVSAAAHYSIKKAANVLGYGEAAVRLIPVTSKFRMDVSALSDSIRRLRPDEYVAAVIGIVGTTEEGAVDAIHEIATLRDELCANANRSFWLHADAAWGGYFRSLFAGRPELNETSRNLDELCERYQVAINARAMVRPMAGGEEQEVSWDDPSVYKAFIAMGEAESITVDPHKMGYVPYPAGLVAFKNGLVTELLTQEAQYISRQSEGIQSIDEPGEIKAVGPYILEGSKPGFVATGCWLAHKTIPLVPSGHGQLVKTAVLNAKKLHRHLDQHRKVFLAIERECGFIDPTKPLETQKCPRPFTFVPLNFPDTNVLCFIARPMSWKDGKLDVVDTSLKQLNAFNERIQAELDIPQGERGRCMPYSKEFFAASTRFKREMYSYSSLKPILGALGVDEKSYNEEGLVVLRSTVMNPLYSTAEGEGMDYLRMFVLHLHRVARDIATEL
jgi:glutamate/tyrosine decarboxylase-like PLP-dependent enzyme